MCNKEFTTTRRGKILYCSRKCCNDSVKQRMRNEYREEKAKRDIKKMRKTTLDTILRELAEYNEEHGTNLSYGKYMLVRDNQRDVN